MQLLHSGHPGNSRMKAVTRSWPGINSDMDKECESCQLNQKAPKVAPLHPWDWPSQSWTRIHVDHAGPFMETFSNVVDAHFKWLEVKIVPPLIFPSNYICSETDILKPRLTSSSNIWQWNSIHKHWIWRLHETQWYSSYQNIRAKCALGTNIQRSYAQDFWRYETRIDIFLFHYQITPHTTTLEPHQLNCFKVEG